MDNLPVYLLQVSIGTGLFYICFILFFKNDTFYLRNRILLISSLLIPYIIPFVKIPTYLRGEVIIATNNTFSELLQPGRDLNTIMLDKFATVNYNNIFIGIYFSIMVILLIKGFLSVTRTCRLIRKATILDSNFPKIVISDQQHSPFSFFPYIVIPRNIYDSNNYIQILEHESAHIRQGHTFDLLLNELIIAFQWFNPFIWLIKKSILLNHEFLADRSSLREAESIKEYQYSLLNVLTISKSVPLTHNFANLIKARVIMINKKSTTRYAILKNLVILPAVIALLVIFSFKGNPTLQEKSKQPSIFSKDSQAFLRTAISTNTLYPDEAIKNNISGRFTVIVKTAKGGKVEKINVLDKDKKNKVPYISDDCINIVRLAYPESIQTKIGSNIRKGDLTILTDEGVRIAKSLHYFNLPECQEKSLEFAINLNFQLVRNESKSSQRNESVFASLRPGDQKPLVFVNGKGIKYEDIGKNIDPSKITQISILKDTIATAKYGDNAKNGVIWKKRTN
jgi:beta-lactamase regulating signal transducer with metallopeptidase domain